MKKQHFFLIGAGLLVFILLYFFGNTVPPKKNLPAQAGASAMSIRKLTTEDVLAKAKQKLSAGQVEKITELENSVVRGDIKTQQEKVYAQLSRFWTDDMKRSDIGAYYTGQEGALENSEKKLTFAAHLLLNGVLVSDNDPAMQTWMATNAKAFFDKALSLNPSNDSSRIGLGACYIFGNISDNPMQGILPVRAIADKHPDNVYAQMILGLGDIKSGQYENAVGRFQKVLKIQPDNMEASLNLAETYDRMGDKANAIKWYTDIRKKINIPEARKELDDRIQSLQQ